MTVRRSEGHRDGRGPKMSAIRAPGRLCGPFAENSLLEAALPGRLQSCNFGSALVERGRFEGRGAASAARTGRARRATARAEAKPDGTSPS